jgi:cyclase
MLTKRVVVCLDVDGDRVVKGTRFVNLRDVGDPSALAERYEQENADEIVLLDISATQEKRRTLFDLISRTASRLTLPLTVGGGVRSVDDVRAILRSGGDKVGINSAAVADPSLLSRAADEFGSQCVVAAIDVRRENGSWKVYTHGGRQATGLDAIDWTTECVERGAGEILLTSVDRDGTRSGYDVELVRAIAGEVNVPVVASGGAGSPADIVDVLRAGADAALVAGIVHDGVETIASIKEAMAASGLPVRDGAAT